MIPEFTQSGVLPPFLPESSPTVRSAVSPYRSTLPEFVERFAISEARKEILIGFLEYRIALKSVGISDGFQWVDGSFVEDIESTENRDPNDIDVVTFHGSPRGVAAVWRTILEEHLELIDPSLAKSNYKCDAYLVNLTLPPQYLVKMTKYWYGLFTHKRANYLWKGMIEISLDEDETHCLAWLRGE